MVRLSRFICLAAAFVACTAGGPEPDFNGLVDTGGAQVFVSATGQGEPVVIIHGGPAMPHRYLLPGMSEMNTRHRTIFYDQRGSGSSPAPLDSGTINLPAFVADIDAIREHFGYERIHVLGHSFGAYLAVTYAVTHADRVASLILSNPTEPGHRFDSLVNARSAEAQTEDDRTRMAELRGSEGFAERDPEVISEFFRAVFAATFADRAKLSELVIDFAPHDVDALFQVGALLFPTFERPDHWKAIRGLAMPTLVVAGEADPIPPELIQALSDAFPNGRRVTIPGAGHFPYIEAPDAYLDAVSAFITEHAIR